MIILSVTPKRVIQINLVLLLMKLAEKKLINSQRIKTIITTLSIFCFLIINRVRRKIKTDTVIISLSTMVEAAAVYNTNKLNIIKSKKLILRWFVPKMI